MNQQQFLLKFHHVNSNQIACLFSELPFHSLLSPSFKDITKGALVNYCTAMLHHLEIHLTYLSSIQYNLNL